MFAMRFSVPALVLFTCAVTMGFMGTVRWRAGQKQRALFNFFMAACMVLFGLGYR